MQELLKFGVVIAVDPTVGCNEKGTANSTQKFIFRPVLAVRPLSVGQRFEACHVLGFRELLG